MSSHSSRALPQFLLCVVLVGIVLGLGLLAHPSAQNVSSCKNCDVLLIMIDTLAADHIQAFGYERDTMPKTTAFFKKNGIIFTHAYANSSWTLPSFNSLFFSDVPTNITYKDIEGARPRLQSALRDAGFHVRGLLIPPLVFISETIAHSWKKGEPFQPLQGMPTQEDPSLLNLPGAFDAWETERVKTNIPYFAMVHTNKVHDPYAPSSANQELFELASLYKTVTLKDLVAAEQGKNSAEEKKIFALRYDQGIRDADDSLGAFLNSLPPETLARTAIIVSADHGEAFGEHTLFWHANSAYDELLHVPLFMHIPGATSEKIDTPVQLMDIAPTVLSLMNVPVPSAFKGVSLLPLISGKEQPFFADRILPFEHGKPYFFNTEDLSVLALSAMSSHKMPLLETYGALGADHSLIEQETYGVRKGNIKLIQTGNGMEAYDTVADPTEQKNLLENPSALSASTQQTLNELSSALATLKK